MTEEERKSLFLKKLAYIILTNDVPNPVADLRKRRSRRNLLQEKNIPKGTQLVLRNFGDEGSRRTAIMIHPSSQLNQEDPFAFVKTDESELHLKLLNDILANSEETAPTSEDWVREETQEWNGELKLESKILAVLLDNGKISRQDLMEAKKLARLWRDRPRGHSGVNQWLSPREI
jgi:hypothetical protein